MKCFYLNFDPFSLNNLVLYFLIGLLTKLPAMLWMKHPFKVAFQSNPVVSPHSVSGLHNGTKLRKAFFTIPKVPSLEVLQPALKERSESNLFL